MEKNNYSVAVLGAGNIGSAVISRLQNLDNDIVQLVIKKVLVSDLSKDREIDNGLLTDNFDEILSDDSIDLVIEVLGGICLLYTSPSPRDRVLSRMPSSA